MTVSILSIALSLQLTAVRRAKKLIRGFEPRRRLAVNIRFMSILLTNLIGGGALAANEQIQMPSGNVFCYAEPAGVRCDIMQTSNQPPPRPANCEFDYGKAFWLPAAGKPERMCVSDTVADPSARKLQYEEVWVLPGIECTSKKTGLTCVNRDGHGFELKRSEQRLF